LTAGECVKCLKRCGRWLYNLACEVLAASLFCHLSKYEQACLYAIA